ncbi:Ku protein [Streptomyces sp. NPDC051219]|uniref:non-homologous end joining protein Ku n=1 Tax=Streptomyces sp. NPDC051219 TaxID=3155283 RepID=UPI00343ED8F3
MPRPVWKGAISFGLVTIPISVLPATENKSIAFRQFHLEDMGRIRTRKVCEAEGRPVPNEDIGRGYELPTGDTILITDEDLDAIPLPTARAIEILGFVPAESIDPVRIGTSYYLAADGAVAAKPYTLLRKALERSSKVAVAKFAWHNRERLGLLRIKDKALVLHAMHWPDEIRDPSAVDTPQPMDVPDEELDAAQELMDAYGKVRMEDLRDEYRAALERVIEAKAAGQRPPQPEAAPEPAGQVVDLMAALQQSVQSARESRGEDATVHDMPARKKATQKAAKTAPAKQTEAKRTTAKKSTAKKTAARKPRSA